LRLPILVEACVHQSQQLLSREELVRVRAWARHYIDRIFAIALEELEKPLAPDPATSTPTPQTALEERLQVAAEATRLEAAGADWEAKHVAAVLGCARATVYDTYWLKRISRRVGGRGRRWTPSEVRAAQAIESTRRGQRPLRRDRGRTA
jgi:predicted DNA-binding transcriptional regulator AlpA